MQKRPPIPLSFEEKKLIEKYLNQGLSQNKIASLINRSQNGISSEVRRVGLPYSAERSLDISRKNRLKRGFTIFQTVHAIEEKISLIEMQLEIITEYIKGIQNDT